jgi:hypothetical protein
MSLLDVKRKIAEKLGEEDRLPCLVCKVPTKFETLSNYGARCWRCYEDYCLKAPRVSGPQARNNLTRH